MPGQIGRGEVQRLLTQGAQLVEVLPEGAYRKQHLPGAINIPLTKLDRHSTSELERDRPTVVYCFDTQ
jgi:rhodanese-related sulfurtransferase